MTEHSPYYVEKVVAYYIHKKKADNLADCFRVPTPANLRDECIATAHKGIDKKDFKFLLSFFKKAKGHDGLMAAIEKCDIDKFRPLQTFLKTLKTKTDEKNIDLLAWLIDYPYRPYELGKTYGENISTVSNGQKEGIEKPLGISTVTSLKAIDSETKGIGENENLEENSEPGEAKAKESLVLTGGEYSKVPLPQGRFTYGKMLLAFASILLLIPAGIYFYYKKGNNKEMVTGTSFNSHEACMYWTGDHYQQVPCTQKLGDTVLIPLDSDRMIHFKKLLNWDIVTKNSIDYFWYYKISKDSLELYTADGYHPVYWKERLMHLTPYMYKKYIEPRSK